MCAEKRAQVLDAPVSGGTPGAQAGTLTFMVGCQSDVVFEQSKPILSCMGKNLVYCGTHGNGQGVSLFENSFQKWPRFVTT